MFLRIRRGVNDRAIRVLLSHDRERSNRISDDAGEGPVALIKVLRLSEGT